VPRPQAGQGIENLQWWLSCKFTMREFWPHLCNGLLLTSTTWRFLHSRIVSGMSPISTTNKHSTHQILTQIELTFYVPSDTKIGHFGEVLPSQSLGIVLKKLNLTQQKQTKQHKNKESKPNQKTTQNAESKQTHKKRSKRKTTLIFKNCSYVCVCVCISCHIQHSTERFRLFSLLSSRHSS